MRSGKAQVTCPLEPCVVAHMVSDLCWLCIRADTLVGLSRNVCVCYHSCASPSRPALRAGQLFTPLHSTLAGCVGTLARTPQQPCHCQDAATLPQGWWHLAEAKATLQSPLASAKGPIKQTRDQGSANCLEWWLYFFIIFLHYIDQGMQRKIWYRWDEVENPAPWFFMLKNS